MGYPYGKTYLEQIKDDKKECEFIRSAFYVLRDKYCRENKTDSIALTMKEQFMILGEAFDLASFTLNDVNDEYHFMWDVIDELLGD